MKKDGNMKLLKFKSNGKKALNTDGEVVDHGTIGNLQYEVYKRGVIHIFKNDLKFKKDCDSFEIELEALDFDSMKCGSKFIIKGSGDNDHLIFEYADNEIILGLEKRGQNIINKLKSIVSKGKVKK